MFVPIRSYSRIMFPLLKKDPIESNIPIHSHTFMYRLPQDVSLRQQWIDIIGTHQQFTAAEKATKDFNVCNKHFRPEDLIKHKGRIVSKNHPSIFPTNTMCLSRQMIEESCIENSHSNTYASYIVDPAER